MTLLAHPDPPEEPTAHHGIVVKAPESLDGAFTVRVPDFDDNHVAQIRRWMPRGEILPEVGDEVLVLVDDRAEPWVVAWWPAP